MNTVDRTTVRVDVDGEQQAANDARRWEAMADRVEAKAQKAKREVHEADLAGRKLSLFQRALRKGKLEGGPVEIGPQGFGVNRGWMSGRGAGAVAGPLLATYAVQRGADMISNTGNQIADYMQDGETLAEVLKRAPGRIANSIGAYVTAASVKLAGMITRFTAGYTAEESDLAQDDAVTNAFGHGPSQLDQLIDAQRIARREHLKQQAALNLKESREKLKKREAIDTALEKIDEAVAAKLGSLRGPQLPIRVSDELWHEIRHSAKERERRRGEILKKRVSAGAGS
jgi:hypothetical protein